MREVQGKDKTERMNDNSSISSDLDRSTTNAIRLEDRGCMCEEWSHRAGGSGGGGGGIVHSAR
jgi:sarcosine oxidase delta subunit